MIGQIIGNYKIEEKLGEGGMGAVYRGVDTMLDREVAIKALRPELASQTAVVERFRSEAVTLAKLNHPNIATLYTMFRQGAELYMVLEFVRGETLDSLLQRRGALPAEEAIPVFCQVLDGIDHAHELGIVHRDIKPANMMLTEKGTLKVLDFGIARLLGSARMTRAGNIIGTLEYMAPEQVKGLETDGRSDIYALGMMLYEILTGRLPFESENEFELMKMQTELLPPAPRSINPSIPIEVEAAIGRAIQKNPADRFQTAGEFREHLLEAGFAAQGTMRGLTGTHQRPSATHPSRPPVSQNQPGPISASGEIKSTRLGAASAAATPSPAAMKATRLGAGAAPTAPADAMKATRLGMINEPATVPAPASSESFFGRLSAIHYAAAGVLVLFLLGAAAAVPLLLMRGGTAEAETKPVAKPAAEQAERPAVVEMPAAEPPAAEPAAAATPAPTAAPPLAAEPAGGGDLKPVEEKPIAAKPVDKPVAAKPKEKAPPPPKAAAPKAAPKRNAECILTGNC